MPDPSPFLAAAERLADRFRSMPESSLTRLAPVGLDLARRLAVAAQRLEGLPVREMPEAGVFVVGDQIALAAHDLAAAATARPDGDGDGGDGAEDSGGGEGSEAARVLAEALELVAGTAQRLATTRSARM
ncbi:hypothetical protein GXW83_04235 [Streptacidiphilus sp. PB12-B1b]|uniref:hypothetical protein n=1 Tax=Streptacidiphilus sp. PB12-B1b TaxID=2705012 RepID=UPI0015FDD3B3|nr:hypothetical protein [Streptacidiphilus sp. PB12-B1b]QMU75084.1 hypothetical protein GXW83_04235 [Streptacidiphilus sp. PB12-B1b]